MCLIGDEVQNPEETVSGIVYKIEDGVYHFVDEHSIKYAMRVVIKANYLSPLEKRNIKDQHYHLFEKGH